MAVQRRRTRPWAEESGLSRVAQATVTEQGGKSWDGPADRGTPRSRTAQPQSAAGIAVTGLLGPCNARVGANSFRLFITGIRFFCRIGSHRLRPSTRLSTSSLSTRSVSITDLRAAPRTHCKKWGQNGWDSIIAKQDPFPRKDVSSDPCVPSSQTRPHVDSKW